MRLVIIVDLSYAKHLLYMQSLLKFRGVSCKALSLSLYVRVYILSNQKSIALDLLAGRVMLPLPSQQGSHLTNTVSSLCACVHQSRDVSQG
jgi:hypothetical protein